MKILKLNKKYIKRINIQINFESLIFSLGWIIYKCEWFLINVIIFRKDTQFNDIISSNFFKR